MIRTRTAGVTMVTKKIRTEYMKKFKDPKWETFSKCYEDSLKYRLTRRVMEHSHRPWFWEGWESVSDSSGWSTPRLTRNKVAPLSLPAPPTSSEVKHRLCELVTSPRARPLSEDGAGDAVSTAVDDAAPTTTEAFLENSVNEASSGLNTNSATDNGPVSSSDGEPVNLASKRRHRRHRGPHSEPGGPDSSHDDKPTVARQPPRAKSQPAIGSKEKENRRPVGRLDWTERRTVRRTNDHHSLAADAQLQPRRESDKRRSHPERRRARSADLEKVRRSQLTVVDERWTTEYMRCFSARLG